MNLDQEVADPRHPRLPADLRPAPASPAAVDYQRLFAAAPDAIFVLDGRGRYIDANPAATVLTGYSHQELLTMRIGDLTRPADRPQSMDNFESLKRTGHTRAERVLQRKDGSTAPVDVCGVALVDGHYLTTMRDISERAVAAEQLRQSLEAYSTLVDLCHAAVVSVGPDGRVRSWNRAAEALFGYSTTEAVGMDAARLVPERLRAAHRSGLARHLPTDTNESFTRVMETDGLRKDGSEVPIQVSLGVGRQGEERVFTAVIQDITRQREVMERLNDALQRLQFHVERMPIAYIVWDVDFRVVEWNPTAERIFGYRREEVIGRHAYDLIVPTDAQPAVDTVWADLLKGDTSSHSINANVRSDGIRLECEWFNTPLKDSAGRIRGVASMAIDITERQAVESRLREAQKLESLGVLASGVAHDFNSSLMVILGNTTLLRATKGVPPRALEHIQLIEEAGARADQLIRHLLTYARTGRHNPQRTEVNGVVRDALMLVRSSIRRNQELRADLADDLPEILADHSQLAQIVLNLCLNARDAMPEGGEIHITTRETQLSAADAARCVPYNARPGRYVELTVRDNGCGMDENTVRRMFDPFFTTKPHGHGLGMAAVLGILRQHSALALVDSKLGRGTTVRVFFPPALVRLVAVDPPSRTQQSTSPHRRSARPRRR